MNERTIPIPRTKNIVIQKTGDELLIYDLDTDRASCLNATSALIWKTCDGSKSVEQITESISQELGSSVETELIAMGLQQLEDENLIVKDPAISAYFGGVSRRDMIRRVGFSSAIALPIISSIVSPVATNAQSNCLPVDAVCDINNDMCCPGFTCQNIFGPNFFFCRP